MLSGATISLFTALFPACLPTVGRDLVQDSGVMAFPVELSWLPQKGFWHRIQCKGSLPLGSCVPSSAYSLTKDGGNGSQEFLWKHLETFKKGGLSKRGLGVGK